MPESIYIHIPFCTHICFYCDFNKVFLKGQPVDEYLQALHREMETTFQQHPPQKIKTIFIGGGTPTALNEKQLDYLMQSIHSFVQFDPNIEFSIEANPGDLTTGKLKVLKDHGVNRLSLGVQSFNDDLLKAIGRSHKAKDVYVTVEEARKIGFENISIDLMYGLPNQTLEDVGHSLEEFFRLNLEHCSAYSLIVESKTIFYNLMKKGKLPLPSEDIEAAMYERIMNDMNHHGYHQYEISNYAKKGYESKHNIVYWDNENYYGLGAGAHGYIGSARRSNVGPVNKYIQAVEETGLAIREEITLTKKDKIEEEMFLGLRKTAGVSVKKFKEKFSVNPFEYYHDEIEKLTNEKLIEVNDEFIRLTEKGRFLGNIVFQEFIK
ncbi:radical SAM family heme chaperone HemW [Pallidibacillus pasinlerensis]|uniref:Heme chaperone HemW n=1 Tax=Pallidibacillus pasinlerensis TaxID=2703818 RepID=A0ABX0A8L9_9BACI|nr:radical SAM family heme chaperone HemW [Pallidibacillus pasinlerensis]NCU17467.1 oxygen-independent coproporphyrinogen III oxidase [Pallidibacillus pasinlerensis]